MSYEGYIQSLCEKGHQGPDIDCYSSSSEEIKQHKCQALVEGEQCLASLGWTNSVDDTNCDSRGYRFMEQLTEQVVKTCDMGHEHIWTAATFEPSKNAYWYDQEKGWVETQQQTCPDCGESAWLNIRKDDPSDTWCYCGNCNNLKLEAERKEWEAERKKARKAFREAATQQTWHCSRCDKDVMHYTQEYAVSDYHDHVETECSVCGRVTSR